MNVGMMSNDKGILDVHWPTQRRMPGWTHSFSMFQLNAVHDRVATVGLHCYQYHWHTSETSHKLTSSNDRMLASWLRPGLRGSYDYQQRLQKACWVLWRHGAAKCFLVTIDSKIKLTVETNTEYISIHWGKDNGCECCGDNTPFY